MRHTCCAGPKAEAAAEAEEAPRRDAVDVAAAATAASAASNRPSKSLAASMAACSAVWAPALSAAVMPAVSSAPVDGRAMDAGTIAPGPDLYSSPPAPAGEAQEPSSRHPTPSGRYLSSAPATYAQPSPAAPTE
jgi:hypothetical protein